MWWVVGGQIVRRCSLDGICHFFLLLRPQPTSTLFPYTTLFRSGSAPSRSRATSGRRSGIRHARSRCRRGGSRRPSENQDRKSTRLNSSHPSISYAVFCLKKKTKREGRADQRRSARDRSDRCRDG